MEEDERLMEGNAALFFSGAAGWRGEGGAGGTHGQEEVKPRPKRERKEREKEKEEWWLGRSKGKKEEKNKMQGWSSI